MIDYIFNLIINKSNEISSNLYSIIDRLEFNYTENILKTFKEDKIQMLKDILFVLYELEKDNFQDVISKIKREDLINLYNACKTYETDDFIAYYKKTIINEFKMR